LRASLAGGAAQEIGLWATRQRSLGEVNFATTSRDSLLVFSRLSVIKTSGIQLDPTTS
jgi:hypothetical protein